MDVYDVLQTDPVNQNSEVVGFLHWPPDCDKAIGYNCHLGMANIKRFIRGKCHAERYEWNSFNVQVQILTVHELLSLVAPMISTEAMLSNPSKMIPPADGGGAVGCGNPMFTSLLPTRNSFELCTSYVSFPTVVTRNG
jgi:hypothetical protein